MKGEDSLDFCQPHIEIFYQKQCNMGIKLKVLFVLNYEILRIANIFNEHLIFASNLRRVGARHIG